MITNDTAWLLLRANGLFGSARGLAIAELGNQWTRGFAGEQPFKPIAQWLGFRHTSFDLNGLDGAVILDLSKPLPEWFRGQFDIVTNFGTTEHVQTTPDFRDQWQAFTTIHDLLKPTGAVIHVIPNARGAHWGSGAYEDQFLANFAKAAGYHLLECYASRSDVEHMAGLMLKVNTSAIPDLAVFSQLGLIKPKVKQ